MATTNLSAVRYCADSKDVRDYCSGECIRVSSAGRGRERIIGIRDHEELLPLQAQPLKTTGNSYALANGVSSAAQAKKMGHTTTRMADNEYRALMDAEVVKAVEVYGNRARETG